MSDELRLHLIRKSDLESEDLYRNWDDPEGLSRPTPSKRACLLSNPLSRSPDDPVQIVGTAADRVIGRVDLIAGEIIVAGEPVSTYWGSAMFVSPEHRNSGMGLMLTLKMQSMHPTMSVCGVSQAIYAIYEKLRWTIFPMQRHILLRTSRAVLERYAGRNVAGWIASRAADVALLLHRGGVSLYTGLRRRDLRTRRASVMPQELGARLAQTSRPVAPHRSVAWFNWLLGNRFFEDPRNERALFLIEDHGGRAVGFFLVKAHFHESATRREFKNLYLGSLQDWQIFEPVGLDVIDVILIAARELLAMGVDAVEVCLHDEATSWHLRKLGFVRVGELHLLFRASGKSPLVRREYHHPDQWRLRPADGDNFFA